jgi:two-component system, NarL family, sensor histidine kinase DesK
MRSRQPDNASQGRQRWLKSVTGLGALRGIGAELDAAHEQLWLADDVNHILGRALEIIAFKTELASRLLEADPVRARTELKEVQRLARESLHDVRVNSRETSSTDLVGELAGARMVLEAAGITLEVRGDATMIGAPTRTVLGRVLRGATTNVLRHAEPRHCTVEMNVANGIAHLRVVDDGEQVADAADAGSQLDSLRRYVDEHAGRLDAGPSPDGMFRLDAVLPEVAR